MATGDAPVLDAIAEITAVSLERTDPDARSLILVRLAALIAVDAPAASYLLQVGRPCAPSPCRRRPRRATARRRRQALPASTWAFMFSSIFCMLLSPCLRIRLPIATPTTGRDTCAVPSDVTWVPPSCAANR